MMRARLEIAGQILFAALLTAAGVGMVLASLLPYWLAIRAAVLLAGFFVGGSFVLLSIILLWCGMLLQRREHDARIIGVLQKAGINGRR